MFGQGDNDPTNKPGGGGPGGIGGSGPIFTSATDYTVNGLNPYTGPMQGGLSGARDPTLPAIQPIGAGRKTPDNPYGLPVPTSGPGAGIASIDPFGPGGIVGGDPRLGPSPAAASGAPGTTTGNIYGEMGRVLQNDSTRGDAFQSLGDANQGQMGLYGRMMSGVGAGYADTGAGYGAQLGDDRGMQYLAGNMGLGAGAVQMGQSSAYGNLGAGDYNSQQGLGATQQSAAALAGLQGQRNFQQGAGYGAQGLVDSRNAAAARMGQNAYGALGGGYGGSQMGTSAGLLGGAAQDYGSQQGSRQQGLDAISRLQSFYQQGPGPSAAEAQLRLGGEQSMASALSLARSGRGAGDNSAALRQAQFQNAATQQQTDMQAAQLRAQESANWRGQQLGAMGQEQTALGNVRGQDLSSMGQNLGAAAQFGGLGYQGIGLGASQENTTRGQDISSAGQNIGAMTSLYGLGYQGSGQNQAVLGQARGQDLTAYGANLGAQQGMAGLGYQGYGLGLNAATTAGAQDLGAMGQNNQTGLGYAQLGQGYQGMGLQNQLGYSGLANDQYQNADQVRNQQLLGMLSADTSRYGADKGVAIAQAQMAQQRQAAQLAAGATLASGVIGMLSDIRAKTNIEPADVTKTFPAPKAKEKRKPKGLLEKLFGIDDSYDPQDPMSPSVPGQAQANPYVQEVPLPGQNHPMQMSRVAGGGTPAPPGFTRDPATGALIPVPNPYAYDGPGAGGDELSDERAKTDLRPARGYSYEYKDPSAPGAAEGRHYGPMAQDLEKTPAGASTVRTGPDGMKSIDTGRLALVNTSAISENQRRLDRLEALAKGRG